MADTNKKVPGPGSKIAKYLAIGLVLFLGIILALIVMKVLFLQSLYSYFLDKAVSSFGLDIVFSRLIAVLATGALLLSLPSLLAFLFLGKKRKEVLIGAAVVYTIFSFALFFAGKEVFFDRNTGQPAKFYIMTLNGFKFSSAPDIDPRWGIRYKPVTEEVMKQYHAWQKTGQYETMPTIRPGKYFDMLTGEPLVWYGERPEGEIELFPLPGFDPKYGNRLKPITHEAIARYTRQVQARIVKEKNKRDAEALAEKNKQEADSRAEQARREAANRPEVKIAKLLNENKNSFVILDSDLGWYHNASQVVPISSDATPLTLIANNVNTGRLAGEYFMEKIFFVPPSYLVVGTCYRLYEENTASFILGLVVLDGKDYEPIKLITDARINELTAGRETLVVAAGQMRRVIFLLNLSPQQNFQTGYFKNRRGGMGAHFSKKY